MLVDTLSLHSRHLRPTRNEFKEAVSLFNIRARWDDTVDPPVTTALPEGMVHEGIESVEQMSEALKSHQAKTYIDYMGDEAKNDPNITRYKTGEELYKGFKSQSELVGKKGVIIPDENSDDGVRSSYRKAMGIPDGAEGYQLGELENLHPEAKITPESLTAFKAFAHKHGMSQKQAEGAFADYYGMISETLNKRDDTNTANKNEAETALRNEWGKDFPENATVARRLVEKFGGKDAIEAFGELGNKPSVMKFLSNLGKTISEESFTGVGSIDLSTDAVGAKQRIKAIQADPDFMNPDSPRHKALVEENTRLFAIAYSE